MSAILVGGYGREEIELDVPTYVMFYRSVTMGTWHLSGFTNDSQECSDFIKGVALDTKQDGNVKVYRLEQVK